MCQSVFSSFEVKYLQSFHLNWYVSDDKLIFVMQWPPSLNGLLKYLKKSTTPWRNTRQKVWNILSLCVSLSELNQAVPQMFSPPVSNLSWSYLCKVCMFSPCMWVSSPGHSVLFPKTCMTGYFCIHNFPSAWVWACRIDRLCDTLWWTGDLLRSYPASRLMTAAVVCKTNSDQMRWADLWLNSSGWK